jgi:hypothetical protein
VLWRAGVISILLIAAAIIATDSAELKERWLVPIAAPLTPVLLVWVMRRRGWMHFFPAALGGVAALAMLAALPDYYRKREPLPRADYPLLAAELAQTGASLMLMPDDMAAGVALIDPALPVAQRVDRGGLPCTGTVLLAKWPEEEMRLDAFRARLTACRVEEAMARTVDAGGEQIEMRLLRLVPEG